MDWYRNQLPTRREGSDYDLRPHFDGKIHSPEAAAKLASAALSLDGSLEAQFGQLWHLVLKLAVETPEHQDKLVDLLVDMSHLPDVTRPDLPLLDWEIRRYWNHPVPTPDSETREQREAAVSRTLKVNRFVALLVATDEPIFIPSAWFALVTLRIALETPWRQRSPEEPLEAWIPAAAALPRSLSAIRPRQPLRLHGTINATHYGPACLQHAPEDSKYKYAGMESVDREYQGGESKELGCLRRNVYTPPNAETLETGGGGDLPVLVWIHGSGWVDGEGGYRYDGNYIVQHGIEVGKPFIYVSFNYRLDFNGWLSSKELTDEAIKNAETGYVN
ncbi:Alpha/Beta hydrolase protein [Aspergillus multicolor]|uniref:Alpha/Beta hydrolase protein n=1 Tax=Aspergillus multicolor TaxID=41759 RepID=UPI003CCD3DDC